MFSQVRIDKYFRVGTGIRFFFVLYSTYYVFTFSLPKERQKLKRYGKMKKSVKYFLLFVLYFPTQIIYSNPGELRIKKLTSTATGPLKIARFDMQIAPKKFHIFSLFFFFFFKNLWFHLKFSKFFPNDLVLKIKRFFSKDLL
jgi:hypothetical protein